MTTYNAGDYIKGGVKRTCWLDEGAITVSTGRGLGGGTVPVVTGAAEISNGMVVSVSVDTGNTWENTGGSPVVTRVANNDDLLMGVVISEPEEMERRPVDQAAADTASTIARRLAGRHLRSATVWFPNVIAMTKARLKYANNVIVTPGATGLLNIDVSECVADGGITVNDVALDGTDPVGSTSLCSMHYQAKSGAADVPIMLAFVGGKTLGAT